MPAASAGASSHIEATASSPNPLLLTASRTTNDATRAPAQSEGDPADDALHALTFAGRLLAVCRVLRDLLRPAQLLAGGLRAGPQAATPDRPLGSRPGLSRRLPATSTPPRRPNGQPEMPGQGRPPRLSPYPDCRLHHGHHVADVHQGHFVRLVRPCREAIPTADTGQVDDDGRPDPTSCRASCRARLISTDDRSRSHRRACHLHRARHSPGRCVCARQRRARGAQGRASGYWRGG